MFVGSKSGVHAVKLVKGWSLGRLGCSRRARTAAFVEEEIGLRAKHNVFSDGLTVLIAKVHPLVGSTGGKPAVFSRQNMREIANTDREERTRETETTGKSPYLP
jgi:hypothetical protein